MLFCQQKTENSLLNGLNKSARASYDVASHATVLRLVTRDKPKRDKPKNFTLESISPPLLGVQNMINLLCLAHRL